MGTARPDAECRRLAGALFADIVAARAGGWLGPLLSDGGEPSDKRSLTGRRLRFAER
ncbi:MAG: hypothetical protein JNL87_17140 [Burkholderiaceae bacterium]|nr:hypothetical protein [Burkholderiaceae bacterium]